MGATEMKMRFGRLVALCTEDYLIRHANKGLYNRAVKDRDKGITAEYVFADAEVVCTLSDGTVCRLTDSIEQFACSCPADNLCKHVLIAILDYGRAAEAEEGSTGGNEVPLEEEGVVAENGKIRGTRGRLPSGEEERQAGDSVSEPRSEPESKSGSESELKAGSGTGSGADSGAAAPRARRVPAVDLPPLDFGWLLERPIEELVASFNAGRVEEAAFRLRYNEELEIREDSLLVVRLVRSGIEVAFTDTPGVARALCAVPGPDGDLYKLEALLRYRSSRGLDDRDALAAKLSPATLPPGLSGEFRESINALLSNGLARLPRSLGARFELLAIAARSGGLPNLEREARGIHGELELFFERHVRFSSHALLGRLSRTSLMLDALEQDIGPARQAQLVGRFRSKYYTVPRLDLYALGAEPWETRSSYRGITYYFYCAEDDGLYTYTQARPAYYEGAEFSFAGHYAERSPWKPDLTLRTASSSMLSFRAVKVSAEGRLSSGGSPALSVPPRPPVEGFRFGGLLAERFADLELGRSEVRLFGGPPRRMKLIRAAAIENCVYDGSAQALKLTAVDVAGERLELLVPYHADWSTAINRLEAGRGLPAAGEFYIFASIAVDGVYPISFLQGSGQTSLKLDL